MYYYTNKLDLDKLNEPMLGINIILSEQELTQTRTYIKLITVIGDVGGFMEAIFSLFSILAEILTDTLYTKSLVNYLFSFDLDKKLILVKKKDINIFKTQIIILIIFQNKIQNKILLRHIKRLLKIQSLI